MVHGSLESLTKAHSDIDVKDCSTPLKPFLVLAANHVLNSNTVSATTHTCSVHVMVAQLIGWIINKCIKHTIPEFLKWTFLSNP